MQTAAAPAPPRCSLAGKFVGFAMLSLFLGAFYALSWTSADSDTLQLSKTSVEPGTPDAEVHGSDSHGSIGFYSCIMQYIRARRWQAMRRTANSQPT